MHKYTRLYIGGDETVTQCNDCGAYVINNLDSEVKHYDTCKPTDPNFFSLTDEEETE